MHIDFQTLCGGFIDARGSKSNQASRWSKMWNTAKQRVKPQSFNGVLERLYT